MRKLLLVSIAITVSIGLSLARGVCQGVAEYTATTSHAAAATVKAGSAVGKATQQLAGHLKEKLPGPTVQPRPTTWQASRVPSDHPASANSLTIQSSQGIEVVCGASDAKAPALKAGSPTEPCISSHAKDAPANKANLSSKSKADEKHPSVVTLSFPK
jgi:hypothetical protein